MKAANYNNKRVEKHHPSHEDEGAFFLHFLSFFLRFRPCVLLSHDGGEKFPGGVFSLFFCKSSVLVK